MNKLHRGFLDDILSEQEQTYVRQFYDNEIMREAIRKVLLASIYYNGTLSKEKKADPTRNYMLALTNRRELSDEQLGREVRATAEGVALVESGFSALAVYQTEEIKKVGNEVNPAR